MHKLLLFSGRRGGKPHNASRRSKRQVILLATMIAILAMATLLTACSSGPTDTNTTPTRVGDIPTATPDTTSTTTATTAATATPAPAQGQPNAAVPTPAPLPTSAPVVVPTRPPAPPPPTPTPATAPGTVKVWVQVTDSCQQALSGGTFTVSGPGVNTTTAPTAGGNPFNLGGTGGCPLQQGNCVATTNGCTTAVLNVPKSGTSTYKIIVARTAPGFGTNLSYEPCTGGSVCPGGPEVATVQVSSSGTVSGTILNIYPDGSPVTWPLGGGAYNGAQGNPFLFHEFGRGNGSIQCDGDSDADDFLTGTPSGHCDSDKGNPNH
ncbi:MAG TPA: hypothetical protein VKR06_09865 [Ktedonosporobacter sp.]|nr:hypothetical protein [Ktedonosporobacter sp.]